MALFNKSTPAPADPPQVKDLVEYLGETVRRGGSDLHLSVNAPPMSRVNGTLQPLEAFPLTAEHCRNLILSVINEQQRARLEEDWELDFAISIEGLGRFRGNAHYNRHFLEAAFRHIPDAIPDLQNLGHAPIVEKLCQLREGLVLVTGITGSGKSTTLASMVKRISEQRSGIIISIEDPIEYVFQHSMSIVKQREIGKDTHSFSAALRHSLRQDPDVILVSEMRDLETISTAITASETGHLVLSTLHTMDAPKSLDRMIDAFPADQQDQIVAQLANALQAVVSQRLIPRKDGQGRVLASEVMIMNHGIRACLRQRRFEQILGLMEIGQSDGMRSIDDSLIELLLQNIISDEEALANARDQQRLQGLISEIGNSDRKRAKLAKKHLGI
ncbi:MAG: PilT/PilU family type 4a pilus ATPase [Verrucomicrobiota bacterium]